MVRFCGAVGPAAEPDRRDRRRRDHRREGELLRPRRGGGDARLLHDHLVLELRRRRGGDRRGRAQRDLRHRGGEPDLAPDAVERGHLVRRRQPRRERRRRRDRAGHRAGSDRPRLATWNTSYSSSYDRAANLTYRVLRGATQIFLGQQNEFIDDDPGPGVHTYKFQAMSLPSRPRGASSCSTRAATPSPTPSPAGSGLRASPAAARSSSSSRGSHERRPSPGSAAARPCARLRRRHRPDRVHRDLRHARHRRAAGRRRPGRARHRRRRRRRALLLPGRAC